MPGIVLQSDEANPNDITLSTPTGRISFGRQTDSCDDCGDCRNGFPNGILPDFFAMVIGAARIGGAPPLFSPIWLGLFTNFPTGWESVEPTGVNNGLYRTLEFTAVSTNSDPGGLTTQYQKFIWHPVMGDMYWAFQSSTSVPPRPEDYTYEWKINPGAGDDCYDLFTSDSTGGGDTARPSPFGRTFTSPVIDDWTQSHYLAHEEGDPLNTVEWTLSDPVTMNDVFTSAESACDEVDIESDGITISIDGSPSTATSNLTDDFAVTKSARVVRVAARKGSGAGVVMSTRNATDIFFPVGTYGCGVARLATWGNAVSGTCHETDIFGAFHLGSAPTTITGVASKIKFAFHGAGWCFKKYKLQVCQNHQFGDGITCVDLGCVDGYYDHTSLKFVNYTSPPDGSLSPCFRPTDDVVAFGRFHLAECTSEGSGDGNVIANVSDLPQPCTSGVDICSGDVLFYDYHDCPLQGMLIFDGTTCGVNCGCSVTDLAPIHSEPPDWF
jgi:hypothetical protein